MIFLQKGSNKYDVEANWTYKNHYKYFEYVMGKRERDGEWLRRILQTENNDYVELMRP